MKCSECGCEFMVDADEEFPDEVDVCYHCQHEYLDENVPEAFQMQHVFTDCNVCGIKLRTESEHRMGMCDRCAAEGP